MVLREGFKCLWSGTDHNLLFTQNAILKRQISPSQSDHVTWEKKSGFSIHQDWSSGAACVPEHNCHCSSAGIANYDGYCTFDCYPVRKIQDCYTGHNFHQHIHRDDSSHCPFEGWSAEADFPYCAAGFQAALQDSPPWRSVDYWDAVPSSYGQCIWRFGWQR